MISMLKESNSKLKTGQNGLSGKDLLRDSKLYQGKRISRNELEKVSSEGSDGLDESGES